MDTLTEPAGLCRQRRPALNRGSSDQDNRQTPIRERAPRLSSWTDPETTAAAPAGLYRKRRPTPGPNLSAPTLVEVLIGGRALKLGRAEP